MTHFLLPVGGAITLTHNCHIDAIGFIHRTNHWSVIKIRQCMWTLLDTSCISILVIIHRLTTSKPFEISKIPPQFSIPNVLRSRSPGLVLVCWKSWEEYFKFKSMCFVVPKVVRLNEIYMCTDFHMNTCKYVWAIHQVFWWCSRGRRRASVPRPGPSLCGVLMAADSNVCEKCQEFLTMLSPPKMPGW